MLSRNSFASILMASVLAVSSLGVRPGLDAALAGQSVKKSGEGARSYVLEGKRRGQPGARGPRIPLPIGPSYTYYDYPYYYSRGHYPRHIGGYVYYVPTSRGRCSDWKRRCIAKVSYYRGRASSRRQKGACKCF